MERRFIEGKGPVDLLHSIEMEIIRKEAEADALMSVKQMIEGMTEPAISELETLQERTVVRRNAIPAIGEVSNKPEPILPVVMPRFVEPPTTIPPSPTVKQRTPKVPQIKRVDQMIVLIDAEGPQTVVEISAKVGISKPSIYEILNHSHEAKIWLDKDGSKYILTDKGRNRLQVLKMKEAPNERTESPARPNQQGTSEGNHLRDAGLPRCEVSIQGIGPTNPETERPGNRNGSGEASVEENRN